MGLFDLFREDSAELSVEDMADYVYGVYKVIDKKCNYKDDLSVLNPYERNLYVAMMLEIDVTTAGLKNILNPKVRITVRRRRPLLKNWAVMTPPISAAEPSARWATAYP